MVGVSGCSEEAALASGTRQEMPWHKYPKTPMGPAGIVRLTWMFVPRGARSGNVACAVVVNTGLCPFFYTSGRRKR